MKNILVPTDFSDCANAASDFAIQLAKKNEADVHFLHLIHTPVDWVKLQKEKEELYPETQHAIGHARGELNKWVKKAADNGVNAQQSLVFNIESDEILQQISAQNHDFVVMGSHGAKGLKERFIGSNAQFVLRKAEVPVFIVKEAIDRPIRNLLFLSDFKDISDGCFQVLSKFANRLGAHVDLLMVNTPNHSITKEIAQKMNELSGDYLANGNYDNQIIAAPSIEEGMNYFIKTNPVDLVAIGTHGKTGFQQLFSPSIAERIANHTPLPTYCFKIS